MGVVRLTVRGIHDARAKSHAVGMYSAFISCDGNNYSSSHKEAIGTYKFRSRPQHSEHVQFILNLTIQGFFHFFLMSNLDDLELQSTND